MNNKISAVALGVLLTATIANTTSYADSVDNDLNNLVKNYEETDSSDTNVEDGVNNTDVSIENNEFLIEDEEVDFNEYNDELEENISSDSLNEENTTSNLTEEDIEEVNDEYLNEEILSSDDSTYENESYEKISVEKLKNDLNEFKEVGSKNIDEDNSLHLLNKTGLSAEELEEGIKDTNLKGLGKAFALAEETYGVNSIFLESLARFQSGNGNSEIFRLKNNVFGLNAYGDDAFKNATYYDEKTKSILLGTKFIKENYLTEGGIYFEGYSTSDVNKHYAASLLWADCINQQMIIVTNNILNSSSLITVDEEKVKVEKISPVEVEEIEKNNEDVIVVKEENISNIEKNNLKEELKKIIEEQNNSSKKLENEKKEAEDKAKEKEKQILKEKEDALKLEREIKLAKEKEEALRLQKEKEEKEKKALEEKLEKERLKKEAEEKEKLIAEEKEKERLAKEALNDLNNGNVDFAKLKSDLADFLKYGSNGISKDNYFHVTNKTGFTAEQLEAGMAGDMVNKGLGEVFSKAEKTYGVNAILLEAIARLESGNGTSRLAKEKNNYYGYTAYDNDPYNSATTFNSAEHSTMVVAKALKENYLTEDGIYYNGLSTNGINVKYASAKDWANKVNSIMKDIANAIIRKFA
ncbi:MAG: glucosaminidase domain-containing protein [Peptoniphilaceae bacterium]|nr:glucosaminidase domain-containing protein [Peptoniphilaceae bacterium]MDD7383944.1 glucosaminidase domain-containing protein [Peptoniphilaceae bacterium]